MSVFKCFLFRSVFLMLWSCSIDLIIRNSCNCFQRKSNILLEPEIILTTMYWVSFAKKCTFIVRTAHAYASVKSLEQVDGNLFFAFLQKSDFTLVEYGSVMAARQFVGRSWESIMAAALPRRVQAARSGTRSTCGSAAPVSAVSCYFSQSK